VTGQGEVRIDAGHLAEDRDGVRTQLGAAEESHAAALGTRERHRLDQRMIHQLLADRVAAPAHHGEHAFVQPAVRDRALDDTGLEFGRSRVGVVCLQDHGASRRERGSRVAAHDRVRDGEVARAEDGHRSDRDLLQAVVHARARLPVRLRGVDGHLPEPTLPDHLRELSPHTDGLRDLRLQLGGGQAGLQGRSLGELLTDRVEPLGDLLEKCRTFSQTRTVVAVEGGVGQPGGTVDLSLPAEREFRTYFLSGCRIECFHRTLGGRNDGRADKQFPGQCHGPALHSGVCRVIFPQACGACSPACDLDGRPLVCPASCRCRCPSHGAVENTGQWG
jgi:hypothetical protein